MRHKKLRGTTTKADAIVRMMGMKRLNITALPPCLSKKSLGLQIVI